MTLYNIVDLDEKEPVDLICMESVNPMSFLNFCPLRGSLPTGRRSPSITTSFLPGIPCSKVTKTETGQIFIRGMGIGNVTHSRLPWESVWSPHILLHNSAGSKGNFYPQT